MCLPYVSQFSKLSKRRVGDFFKQKQNKMRCAVSILALILPAVIATMGVATTTTNEHRYDNNDNRKGRVDDEEAAAVDVQDDRSLLLLKNILDSNNNLDNCVSTESALRDALLTNTDKTAGVVANKDRTSFEVEMCAGATITLTEPIDYTNLNFTLYCGLPRRQSQRRGFFPKLRKRLATARACTLSGNQATSMFVGSPKFAVFRDVVFANGVSEFGGAVEVIGRGIANFTRCEFINNQAAFGGALAIFADCTVTLSNCVLKGNEASGTDDGIQKGQGGAIFSFSADVILLGTVLDSNQAVVSTIHSNSGVLIMENSQVINSILTRKIGGVGALSSRFSDIILESSTFSNNTRIGRSEPSDLLIEDDRNPSELGSFVQCGVAVNFCNGADGIVEVFDKSCDLNVNSNCRSTGIFDPTSSQC